MPEYIVELRGIKKKMKYFILSLSFLFSIKLIYVSSAPANNAENKGTSVLDKSWFDYSSREGNHDYSVPLEDPALFEGDLKIPSLFFY